MAGKNKVKNVDNQKKVLNSEDRERLESLYHALTVLQPSTQAAATFSEYSQDIGKFDLRSLRVALETQTKRCNNGSLEGAVAMLTAQAHTLDAMFGYLARCAINAEHVDHLDGQLKLALRAQSQCRTTWAAVAAIQNPPVMGYVKQANIAHGPQQVNNTVAATQISPRRPEDQNRHNKLLEQTDVERLDSRASGSPGQANPEMAPVGEISRAKNR